MAHDTPDTVPPPLGIGHLSLNVASVAASYDFYVSLGLRSFAKDESIAIMELRGGTHLLLFPREAEAKQAPERVDLMIAGKTREALETFRDQVVARGVAADPIPDERFFGHSLFRAKDPDGNDITVYTSHAGDLPV